MVFSPKISLFLIRTIILLVLVPFSSISLC
uniref:Uncharacterized protein n=1 Tax=Lepeophtheirus salmonis TaxID=72036 RepID=A0A0K2UHZ2_LEPSM